MLHKNNIRKVSNHYETYSTLCQVRRAKSKNPKTEILYVKLSQIYPIASYFWTQMVILGTINDARQSILENVRE